MASNTDEPDQSDSQHASACAAEADHRPRHSQTLPLITEEIAAARAGGAPIPTEHVTTPVIPPNPIRRDDSTRHIGTPADAPTESVSDPEVKDTPNDEKSSEGRISATQLIAGAGAAATSSVIGGQLGVAGTVVGAGVASIVTALAVTLYGRSLDKGKEKIQKVGSKLAPAVKAKIAKSPAAAQPAVDPSLAEDSAFAPPEPAGIVADPTTASARGAEPGDDAAEARTGTDGEDGPRTWWQNLRRKRVLYPLTIGVAAFGIGLGGVVMAESFTDADISPGTSQISRSVSGQSTNDESGTDGGSSDTGSSDSGSSGGSSSSGSQSGADGQPGSSDSGTGEQTGQSTSAGETGSQGTDSGQTDQGTNTTTDTGTDAGSTTADGTDTSSGTTASDSAGSAGGAGDTSGGADGASSSGGNGSSADSGGSSGSGTGGSAGGSSGGSAASGQG